jgi:hypothetical protein
LTLELSSNKSRNFRGGRAATIGCRKEVEASLVEATERLREIQRPRQETDELEPSEAI